MAAAYRAGQVLGFRPGAHLSTENPCWCQKLKPLHLAPFVTERGFLHMPTIKGTYPADAVKVYESSAASEACVWVSVMSPRATLDGLTAHLTLEAAGQLRDQLTYLIENHYQVNPR